MFRSTLKHKSSINIIPMIDVIFFLLVFFMLFTTFKSSPTGIDLQLPRAVTVSEQKNQNITFDIDSSGNIYYSGKKITLDQAKKAASEVYQKNKDVVAIINADREVRYLHIISVMDNLRQAGIYKLALAADKKE